MHDILIGGLIAIIVIAQIYVAITTSKKISLFKAVVPAANNFETVKVFVQEADIKTVTVEYIFNNVKKFSDPNLLAEPSSKKTKKKVTVNEKIDEKLHSVTVLNEFPNLNLFDEAVDDKEMIWITKGNLEKKILLKSLSNYITIGWVPLTDYNSNSKT
ncbi:hypothetical protein [Flavobacterium sandaracinum]|uniref:Uncharacterized protein n=1 Tax=Flavobacterium sandaracinum TaxID=2541733 RepID=A0A4R5CUC6_9FLAO|nr:hypothetical protein [Flavobacterium sandaracinum]TDE04282.1 hypothetical protein E0F91_09540 [Flavobacterium sandaracinum]